jgi:hypothetical protein
MPLILLEMGAATNRLLLTRDLDRLLLVFKSSPILRP